MLSQEGIQVVERDVFRQPLGVDELRSLLRGGEAADLFARRSRRASELRVDPESLGEEELLALLAREPGLLRRPIVDLGGTTVIGLDVVRLRDLARSVRDRANG